MQTRVERETSKQSGELLATEHGRISGVRVLPDGKIEESFQGMGKLLGMDYVSMYTAVGSQHPGGTVVFEANGIVTTIEGDASTVKIWGVNHATGLGFKASGSGGAITQTAAPKLARLNNIANVWEAEIDENGDYHLNVWEWK